MIFEDLQNMPGTQNTFFHIFNHLHQHDRQIIMSSDCAPSEMEGFEARLLSRFKWGMQVELERPDIALRRNVLKLKADSDGLLLPADVSEFIASNVTRVYASSKASLYHFLLTLPSSTATYRSTLPRG